MLEMRGHSVHGLGMRTDTPTALDTRADEPPFALPA